MNKQIEKLKEKVIQDAKECCKGYEIQIKIRTTKIGANSYKLNIVELYRKRENRCESIIVYNRNGNRPTIFVDPNFLYNKQDTLTGFIEETHFTELKLTITLIKDFLNFIKALTDSQKFALKELRKQRNLTQQQLADELGVTLRTVQGWETVGVNSDMAKKFISLYFGVPENSIEFNPTTNTKDNEF